ncbi:MAG: VPLPA-CTERM sorting domain-containing protein [Gammaproteobacteria bacterium]|uniref:VPLPA-CTERM sorting domain-containing protein n=1 Tax=Oceanicoccus sp. TaxID=2691044 RepID=UPI0026050AEE|nr:VPLPA-CTERM sorting domain-containing protein [Oceanicoccus sp.]MCP3908415.1 VPLPA-CTERM sorting domain-containing protein [Oceanicoccus sp.]MCP4791352.1 VPLPA-CTERM sorting domain-containing protein [Gammaproteobacteria bacterium]
MHSAFLSLLFVASTSVHAVTVDFESDISNVDIQGFSSKGFDFVGNANFWDLYVDGGGNTTAETADPGCGGCVGVGWMVTASNGNAFSLESVDLGFFANFGLGGQAAISGALSGGGTVSRLVTDSSWHTESAFGAQWSDLTSVGIYITSGVPQTLTIDNFSASIVPIPAAVWLFGSALAGLGWLRRKQTV